MGGDWKIEQGPIRITSKRENHLIDLHLPISLKFNEMFSITWTVLLVYIFGHFTRIVLIALITNDI